MALSMSVRRGDKIGVGGQVLSVLKIVDPHESIMVAVDGGIPIKLTSTYRIQLSPEVYASVGLPADVRAHAGTSRIAFEAPQRVRIKKIGDELDALIFSPE